MELFVLLVSFIVGFSFVGFVRIFFYFIWFSVRFWVMSWGIVGNRIGFCFNGVCGRE